MQPSVDGESLAQAEATVEVVESEPKTAPAEPEPTPTAVDPFPLADPGEYYVGLWSGKPNYGCPYCLFATLEGNGRVELHILEKIDQGSIRHQKALELHEGGLA